MLESKNTGRVTKNPSGWATDYEECLLTIAVVVQHMF